VNFGVGANEESGVGGCVFGRGKPLVLILPVAVFVQSSPEPSCGRGWSTVMGDLGNRYSTLDQTTRRMCRDSAPAERND
jgi:hypothetical protein